jgi:exosortase E/protease (VPEID-CTERM system)
MKNPDSFTAGNVYSPSGLLSSLFRSHLLGRLYLLGAMVALESLLCFPVVNRLFGHQRFPRTAIVSYAVFLGLGYAKFKSQLERLPFDRILFGGHLICVGAVFVSAMARLHGGDQLHFDAVAYSLSVSGYAWSAVYLLGTLLLALACVPLPIWIRIVRVTSPLWLYSFLAGVAAWGFSSPLRSLWDASSIVQNQVLQIIAFRTVLPVVRLFLPDVAADPAALLMGTPRFTIKIAGGCSGIEGLGLILVFSVAWLWYFRKETRFPQALLLIPCAMGCIWLLNIARLSALILIGDQISPDVAMVGFHSQFGWISFTIIALTFSMATQRLSWVRKAPSTAGGAVASLPGGEVVTAADASEGQVEQRGESPAIRAYLVPFLAILAASFISKAASGYFEWLYPLRFVAAAIAIWSFRQELKRLNWRFGWVGPVTGAAVFLVWIAPGWWTHSHAASPMGPALAALSPAARWVWIGFRVAAAVVTVPIAEELAFRGYLARRFISREFDGVPFAGLTALSIVLSSAAFGLMHGQHWVVGILAGLAFAGAVRWRGRMGDAVVAHAVSNLLLAAWVLGTGDWAQW